MTAPPWRAWKRPERLCWARPTAMNLPWVPQTKILLMGRCAIHATNRACREDRAADRRRLWRRGGGEGGLGDVTGGPLRQPAAFFAGGGPRPPPAPGLSHRVLLLCS